MNNTYTNTASSEQVGVTLAIMVLASLAILLYFNAAVDKWNQDNSSQRTALYQTSK